MQAILENLARGPIREVQVTLPNAGRNIGSTGNGQDLLNLQINLILSSRLSTATKMAAGKNLSTCCMV